MIRLVGNIPNNATPPVDVPQVVILGNSTMPLSSVIWTTGTKTREHRLLSGYPRVERGQRNATKIALTGDLAAVNAGAEFPIDTQRLDYLRYWEQQGQEIRAIVDRLSTQRNASTRSIVRGSSPYRGYIQNLRITETHWITGIPRRAVWSMDFIVTDERDVEIVRPTPIPTPTP